MDWKIYNITEINQKWNEWDRLNKLYYNSHPYFDSRFIKPLVKYFGNKTIKYAELKDNKGVIQGMLLIEQRMPGLWKIFIPSQLQVAPILLPPAQITQNIKKLFQAIPGYCWMIEILNQDPLNTPINNDIKISHSQYDHCTTTNITFNVDFKNYWKKRPKKFKQNIRTAFNRLKKDNMEYKFLVKKTPEEIIKGIKEYGLLESKSWKGKAGTAIHPENIQGKFYNDSLLMFAQSGNASIYELYISDELAGSILSISNENMLILMKTSFSEQFKKYSPGRLIQYKFIEHEFNQKEYGVMEAYTNANKDQLDWASGKRVIFHSEIYRNIIIKKIVKLKREIKNL